MVAELAPRRLDGHVDLAPRHLDALGDLLEVVDEGFHGLAHDVLDMGRGVAQPVGAEGELGRPADLGVLGHDRPAGQGVQDLLDDPQALAHLGQPDLVAGVDVGAGGRGHVELVLLVAAVGLHLAQVVGQAGGPQHRPGGAKTDQVVQRQVADALGPLQPDRVVGEQGLVLVGLGPHVADEGADLVLGAVGQVLGDPGRPHPGVVHAQPGDVLEDVEDLLPLPEPVEHDRQGAQLQPGGGQPDQVGADPVELHHQHPKGLGPRGGLDAEQLLDGQAVGGLVEDRGQVVHAGHEGDPLDPGPELGRLLDPGVQVADHRLEVDDLLALELDDQPQHPVGGGVLGAHVDDHDVVLALGRGPGRDLGPVAAAHGHHLVGPALVQRHLPGGRGGGQVPGLAGGHDDLLDQRAGRAVDVRRLDLTHVLVQPPLYRRVSGGGMWASM